MNNQENLKPRDYRLSDSELEILIRFLEGSEIPPKKNVNSWPQNDLCSLESAIEKLKNLVWNREQSRKILKEHPLYELKRKKEADPEFKTEQSMMKRYLVENGPGSALDE